MKSVNETDIKSTFVKYVTLNVLGLIGLSCYILADTFFVAKGIGPDGLAALNLAIPVYSFIHGTGLMIGMGGAIRYGISRSKTIFTQAFYFVLIMSFLFVAAGIFMPDQLANLLGADSVTSGMTSTYLQVILCFAPMFLTNNLLICFVRNDGNPKLSMTAMLAGSLSNIILDYVFVFPLQMGMLGAAIATGIAPVISVMILSVHFIRKKNTFQLTKKFLALKDFADMISLGFSSFIVEVSSGIVIIIFNFIILALEGNLGIAAYGIIANLALVAMSIFTGITQGMQPIISKCWGEGDRINTNKVLRYGIITAAVFSILLYFVIFVFAEPVVAIFNKDGNTMLSNMASQGLRLYFISFIFVGINMISASFCTSVDKPKYAFVIAILRGVVVIVPVAFLFSSLFGINGVWLSMAFTELLVMSVSVFMILRLNRLTV